MICKKCGATIDDNSTECRFCGAKYGKEEETKPEKSADEKKTTVNTVAETAEETASAAVADADEFEFSGEEIDRMIDENEKNRQRQFERLNSEKQKQLREIEKRRESKKKKQRRNRILIIIAILAILGGAGTGIYYYISNNGSTPEIEVVTEAPKETEEPGEVVTEEPGNETETEAPAETAQPTQTTGGGASSTGGTGAGNGASGSGSSVKGGSSGGTGSTGGKASASSGGAGSTGSKAASGGASSGSKNTVSTSTAKLASGAKYSANGGFDGETFKAALITGGEVVESGSRKYMKFDFNGTTYYANIDSGTSTVDISGKPMTINAFKTSEVYNGESVYEITALTKYDASYVFPESGYKLLTEADLKGKTARELYVGRNEIYARHGRQFKDKELQTYFASCSWYKIKSSYDTSNDAANLNSIEIANANLIKAYEETHQ